MASAVKGGHGDDRPRMNVDVEVLRYDPDYGVGTWWDDGAFVRAEVWATPEQTVVISGNTAGLVSLARHLLALAQLEVPDGCHFDFDTYSGALTNDSLALRIEVDRRH